VRVSFALIILPDTLKSPIHTTFPENFFLSILLNNQRDAALSSRIYSSLQG
jgi:hypothetical protein